MIRIVCCPSCDEKGALLAEVTPGSKITCSQCGIDYDPIAATAESLPIITATLANHGVQEDSDSELQLSEEQPNKSAPANDPSKWQNYEPITHDQFERLKRKGRSPLWSILQVVLGGAAAIPIALLILWHVLGRDVMDAGPTVAKYAPWIVPEQFHPLAPESPPQDTAPKPGRRGGFRNFDEELGLGEPSDSSQDNSAPRPSPALPSDDAGSSISPQMPPANELDRSSVEQLFPFTKGLFRSISSYEADLANWLRDKETPDADRSSLAKNLYGDLLSIATQLEQFPGENPAFKFVRNEMAGVSGRVKRDEATQELINAGARHNLSSRDWSNAEPVPIALIIRIEQVEHEGDYWQIVPEQAETLKELLPGNLAIRLPTYLSPVLIPGQRLLVLGNIHQSTNLPSANANSSVDTQILLGNYIYSFGSRSSSTAEEATAEPTPPARESDDE